MPLMYGSIKPKKMSFNINKERKYFDSADYTMTGKTGHMHPNVSHYERVPKSSLNICN